MQRDRRVEGVELGANDWGGGGRGVLAKISGGGVFWVKNNGMKLLIPDESLRHLINVWGKK